ACSRWLDRRGRRKNRRRSGIGCQIVECRALVQLRYACDQVLRIGKRLSFPLGHNTGGQIGGNPWKGRKDFGRGDVHTDGLTAGADRREISKASDLSILIRSCVEFDMSEIDRRSHML